MKDPVIQEARVPSPTQENEAHTNETQKDPTRSIEAPQDSVAFGAIITLDKEEENDDILLANNVSSVAPEDFVQSIEIKKSVVEDVKRRCTELDYPLMEEYDFRNDRSNPDLDMDLSPKTVIRDYQEKSLSKMIGGGGGRARYFVCQNQL